MKINITNCTISGNIATGDGAGIYSEMLTDLNISHTTIAFNRADGKGGGLTSLGSMAHIKNVILLENKGMSDAEDDCNGSIMAHTESVVGNICEETLTGDPVTTYPYGLNVLAPLAYNDGATQTHAIDETSPFVDIGHCTTLTGKIVLVDQRNIRRPQGLGCDVGSYEFEEASSIPASATNLEVVTTTSDSITFSWTDNAIDEENYEIYRDKQLLVLIDANSTEYINSGLESNTSYLYEVMAVNLQGRSESIEELNATTEVLVDGDGDGVGDGNDNCPLVPNDNQDDVDGDGIGDACDADNNDGPLGDLDGDGISNQDDPDNNDGPLGDLDGDGVVNKDDPCPNDSEDKCQQGFISAILYLLL